MRLAIILLNVIAVYGGPKRCFSCRSRGELGDCRDPFYLSSNSTLLESKMSGVSTPSCASGWCSKIIEGDEHVYKDADYGSATQRGCLQRPPSDGEERCAKVTYKKRKVNMCFCKGDLCNSADSINNAFFTVFVVGGGLLSYLFSPSL